MSSLVLQTVDPAQLRFACMSMHTQYTGAVLFEMEGKAEPYTWLIIICSLSQLC